MLGLLLTTVFLVAVTVAIHAFGTMYWIRFLVCHYADPDGHFSAHNAMPALTWTAVVLLMLHLVEVIVRALAYLFILPGNQLDTVEKAVYFSVVTFTTLGYGDITLIDHEWRVLSGIEALNGIVLVGWTTALLFAVFQRSWRGLARVHRG
ncbi:MAG: potassium channel family protein [Pseudomonadota bacterium]|nr:potassium channel family protein [Pseudomonadota bacterium]